MKRDLAYWRWIYRTGGGWREVRRCLNCVYGPRAWKRIIRQWWRDVQMRRMLKRMTPAERAKFYTMLKGIGSETP